MEYLKLKGKLFDPRNKRIFHIARKYTPRPIKLNRVANEAVRITHITTQFPFEIILIKVITNTVKEINKPIAIYKD